MAKDVPVMFRVDAIFHEALKTAAAADDRSMSSLCERVLRMWLTEHGYLVVAVTVKAKAKRKSR
jgi:hypothetical protein